MRLVSVLLLASSVSAACGGSQSAPTTPSAAESGSAADDSATTAALPQTSGSTDDGDGRSPATTTSDTAAEPAEGKSEFALRESDNASSAHGATPSKIRGSKTEAALKFVVVDKEKGPIPGIVISLTSPDGTKFMAPETDVTGYTEILVPIGKKYELVYLSLGRQDIAATVPVPDEPNQNIKLTLRYKRFEVPPKLVLDGVTFDTGKASLRPESFPQLDRVVEFLTFKKSARIEISGHTDNVGNSKNNKSLSERRAQACREYLMSKGIDGSRIEARGYGDERPVASNDTEQGRALNRRIEAAEL
jgi:OmpA-OmpF porin, OOP family